MHHDDRITRLCWGGGDRHVLAAASQQNICILSLTPFVQQVLPQQLAACSPGTYCMPSTQYQLIDVYRAQAPLLSIQWTHDAQGLFYTDSHGNIVMLQHCGTTQPAGSSTTNSSKAAVGDPRTKTWPVKELWKVHADMQHGLIAAGACASGPCATAGTANAQRVIIWWPTYNPKTQEYSVGAEVIRHPVKLVHMEWSPSLRSTAEAHSLPPSAGSSPSSPTKGIDSQKAATASPRLSAASGGGTPSSNSSPYAASTSAAAAAAAGTAPCASQPALMTVGVDCVIRMWVEVVLTDIGDSSRGGPSSAPATSRGTTKQQQQQPTTPISAQASEDSTPRTMSQFCLTLVIEPPSHAVVPGVWPGMMATWVRPLLSSSSHSGNSMSPHRMLWLVASYGTYPATSSATPQQQPGMPGHDRIPSAHKDHLYVWAVEGLAGVVLSGIAQNAIMASKLSTPKAILWGGDESTLSWCADDQLSGNDVQHSMAAWVAATHNGPLLLAGQTCFNAWSKYAQLRQYHIHPLLTDGDGTPPSCYLSVRPQQLQAISGPSAGWRHLSIHANADIAAAISGRGQLVLWNLSPVQIIPLPAEAGAHWPHEQQQQQQLKESIPSSWSACDACCWLSTVSPAASTTSGTGALLLASSRADTVDISLVTMQQPQLHSNGVEPMHSPDVSQQMSVGFAACTVKAALGVSSVSILTQLTLPQGVTSLKQLVEVSVPAPGPAVEDDSHSSGAIAEPLHRCMLVGLGVAAQQSNSSNGEAATATADSRSVADSSEADQGSDVWVVWHLDYQQQPASAAQARAGTTSVDIQVVATHVCSVADAVYAPGCSSSNGTASVDSIASISCIHSPSPASPFIITGDVHGQVQLWQVMPDAGVQLVQHSSSSSMLGIETGGIAVGVALCTSAGYAAAATTCGQVSLLGLACGSMCHALLPLIRRLLHCDTIKPLNETLPAMVGAILRLLWLPAHLSRFSLTHCLMLYGVPDMLVHWYAQYLLTSSASITAD